MKTKDLVTRSELKAMSILTMANVSGFTMSTNSKDPHKAGDYIIELAAAIQAERTTAIIELISNLKDVDDGSNNSIH